MEDPPSKNIPEHLAEEKETRNKRKEKVSGKEENGGGNEEKQSPDVVKGEKDKLTG